tara:strand:+ start:331 stop:618 length:288 start_codon:yes stop_codon:yes gene_type:complete
MDNGKYDVLDAGKQQTDSNPLEHVVRRFYVDERSGCVAVRERVGYDISPGLHQDLPDVMAYWSGEKYLDDDSMVRWRVADWQLEKANKLCESLTA